MRKVFILVAFFFAIQGFSAACNEACTQVSDCTDTTNCPLCIGTCVSCFAIGDSTLCADSVIGGNTYCKWDGRNCKPLSDIPELPFAARYWYWVLLPAVLLVSLFVVRIRKRLT